LGVAIDDMLRTDENGKPAGPPLALGVEVVVDGNVGLFQKYNGAYSEKPVCEQGNDKKREILDEFNQFPVRHVVIHFGQRDTRDTR
jgi:hypothetical protein